MPHTSREGCCDGDSVEALTEWEKELLKPNPNLVIHLYTGDPDLRCEIDLSDGKTHAVNCKIENVSCGDCKIIYLTEQNRKLNEDLAKKREELRVSQQAYTSQHRELTNLRRRREDDARQNRRLREDLEYVIRRSGITPPNDRYDGPRYYPVERYPFG